MSGGQKKGGGAYDGKRSCRKVGLTEMEVIHIHGLRHGRLIELSQSHYMNITENLGIFNMQFV